MNHGEKESPAAGRVQLASDDGVFELAGTDPAWIWVHTCPTPACPCRDALVLATHEGRDLLLERGAAVRDAWTAGADFSKVAATLDDVIVFFMDIDTAEVSTLIDDEPLNLAAHPRIADIATRIDGDLLDSIGQLSAATILAPVDPVRSTRNVVGRSDGAICSAKGNARRCRLTGQEADSGDILP